MNTVLTVLGGKTTKTEKKGSTRCSVILEVIRTDIMGPTSSNTFYVAVVHKLFQMHLLAEIEVETFQIWERVTNEIVVKTGKNGDCEAPDSCGIYTCQR